MKFDDYEKKYEAIYAEYAEIVKFILEKAIAETAGISRPQSIQCRAKSATSLEPKLRERGLVESEATEAVIRDLAGVRLIFYTNTDVDRFLNSRLIPENFEIDRDAIKIHHPVEENKGVRYQAIHYTVRINEERAKLPEYAKFKGMRCEIQIQTILNHAWSETSHDIIYKNRPKDGFGSKAMESITNRLNRIMDKYLLPAGYEFQWVQHDYERLQQGKALFDRDALRSLEAARNNNERYELLSSLKEYVLPNYNDIPAIYGDLCSLLIATAKASRTSAKAPIKTPFGDMEGKTTADVVKIIVDIFEAFRYVDIERTFFALCTMYRDEADPGVQNYIIESVKHLAHYNLDVWRQVGSQIQRILMDMIERLETGDRTTLRPLLIAVWSEVLNSSPTGVAWTADAVAFSSGALPVSDELKAIREKAISGLFDLFRKSTSETQKREVISALREATRVPTQVEYSNELLALTLRDSRKIVDFLAGQAAEQSYELLEHLENVFLYDYRRAREIAEDKNDRFGSRRDAEELVRSIEAFRDKINANDQFIRYKTLVGYESVFPQHWENDEFEIEGVDRYRQERIDEYIDAISEASEDQWYQAIERCAAADSSDMATFRFFGDFLYRVSKAKPSIAAKFLERADNNVLNFLPAFLDGLRDSGSNEKYQKTFARYLAEGKRLVAIARHLQQTGTLDFSSINEVLKKAIAANDDIAVIECLVLVVKKNEARNQPLIRDIFIPAINYLIARQDGRWVRGVWYLPTGKDFFQSLSIDEINLVLESMVFLPRIEHQAEKILVYIAENHSEAVWNFLGRRLDKKLEKKVERFESFPYRFHGLEKPLAANAELAINIVLGWFHAGDRLFRFNGGRLLSAVFSGFPEPFAQKLVEVVEKGADEDMGFVVGILQNYKGEPGIHPVFQALINRLPEDDPRLTEIDIALQNTGVVTGEFGFVEAYRRKKAEMAPWLNDSRPRVKGFTEKYIRELDLQIASEQRSAEQSRERRKRAFETDNEK